MSEPLWRIPGLAVARCRECRFLGADLDEWVYPYAGTDYYGAIDERMIRPDRPAIQRRVAGIARLAPRGHVAELGSGLGETAIALAERRYDVDAVDESPAAVAWLSARYPRVRWHQARLQDFLHDRRAEFDVVTLFHVLEHVPCPRPLCARLRAALRDCGVLVVEVPDAGGGRARLAGRRWDHWLPHHVNYFTARTLRRLLEPEGFRLTATERKYHFGFPQGRPARDRIHAFLARARLHDVLCTYWVAV